MENIYVAVLNKCVAESNVCWMESTVVLITIRMSHHSKQMSPSN